MHPALDFLTSRVLTWTPLYGYHVSQNVDRFLRKRHPDIGKKSLSAMLPNPIFSAIGLHPNRQMSKEIGFDKIVKPDLAWKIFRQPCRKVPPEGGIGDRGFPCKRAKCTFALCLRETPALQGRRFTAARGGGAMRGRARFVTSPHKEWSHTQVYRRAEHPPIRLKPGVITYAKTCETYVT